ncbi:MAG: tRNA-dihydrouridine synthase family protein [bacterium]
MTATLPPASMTLRGVTFSPALFCAPMAGITHSAFRRLLADFGGYGALWTEMLSARNILQEDALASSWLRRRPQEGRVIYQLLATECNGLAETIDRLAVLRPDGLDLNIACPAPSIRRQRGGADLFEEIGRLREIVRVLRRNFAGPLLVKTRLGRNTPEWREKLLDRLHLLEDEGVDALTLHPRFAGEKLKRTARHALYAEFAAATRLPIIASGDITSLDCARAQAALLAPAAGLMIGRMAAAQPWFFARWHNPGLVVDYPGVWNRLCDYIAEDFPARQALMRIKLLAPYFARNFLFGHTFFAKIQSSADLETARARATEFLSGSPTPATSVTVSGI